MTTFNCGHEITEENTYLNSRGKKICKQCKKEEDRKYREKKKSLRQDLQQKDQTNKNI